MADFFAMEEGQNKSIGWLTPRHRITWWEVAAPSGWFLGRFCWECLPQLCIFFWSGHCENPGKYQDPMAGLDLNLNLGCSFTHDGCLTVERQEANSKARESSSDFRKIQHRNLLRLVAWLSIDNPSLPLAAMHQEKVRNLLQLLASSQIAGSVEPVRPFHQPVWHVGCFFRWSNLKIRFWLGWCKHIMVILIIWCAIHRYIIWYTYTPLKINIEPKNHPIEKENHLPTIHFWDQRSREIRFPISMIIFSTGGTNNSSPYTWVKKYWLKVAACCEI